MSKRNNKKTSTVNPTVAVAYLRVSTDDQHLGPEAQRSAIEAYASRHGVVVAEWCVDLGVSGGASLDRRPGLLSALAAMETTGAGLLLVAKRDRLARDVMIAAMVEASVKRLGARVVSAAGEGTDDDGPTGLLMRRMVDAFAEYEKIVIGARTKAALAVKSARGERVGSIPLGKRLAADGTLVDCPAELEAMALVNELRASGMSYREIAARVTLAGYRPRGTAWHAQTIQRMVTA